MHTVADGRVAQESAYRTGVFNALFCRAPMALLLVAAAVWAVFHPVNHDVAWYIYASRSILGGAKLYVDVIETNPPLIFAFHLGPAWVAEKLGVSHIPTFHLFFVAVIGVSLVLCRQTILKLTDRVPAGIGSGLFLGLIVILVPLAGVDFGQREHIMLVLVLPYVFSVADRTRTPRPDRRRDWLVGTLAGLGLALKPHFLILWIALESELVFVRKIRPVRRENIAIALLLAVYGLAIVVVTPEYMGTIIPLATKLYGAYDCTMRELLLGMPTFVCAMVVLLLWVRPRPSRTRELERVLFITMCSFFVTAAIQRKGWTYHFYPATATAVLLGIVSFLDRFGYAQTERPLLRRGVPVAGLLLALALTLLATGNILTRSARGVGLHSPAMAQFVRERADHDTIAVLSTAVPSSFPLITICDVESALRFNCLWLLPGHYTTVSGNAGDGEFPYHTVGEMNKTERYLIDSVVADLARSRPALLIVDQRPSQRGMHGGWFDLLTYFRRDERFDRLYHRYRHAGHIGEYAVFERAPGGGASVAAVSSTLHQDPIP